MHVCACTCVCMYVCVVCIWICMCGCAEVCGRMSACIGLCGVYACVVCVCVCGVCIWVGGVDPPSGSQSTTSPLSFSLAPSSSHPTCVSGILVFSVPSALAAVDQKPEAELLHIACVLAPCRWWEWTCSPWRVGVSPGRRGHLGTSGAAYFWSSFTFILGLNSFVLMLTSSWKWHLILDGEHTFQCGASFACQVTIWNVSWVFG